MVNWNVSWSDKQRPLVNYPCLKAGASGIGREDSREASIERDCA